MKLATWILFAAAIFGAIHCYDVLLMPQDYTALALKQFENSDDVADSIRAYQLTIWGARVGGFAAVAILGLALFHGDAKKCVTQALSRLRSS